MHLLAMPAEMASGTGDLMSLLPTLALPVLMLVALYFLMIRPQKKKEKAVKKMLDELKVGDRVMTIGGIYGTISSIKDNTVTIAVGQDKVKLVFDRSAIRGLDDTPSEQQNDVL